MASVITIGLNQVMVGTAASDGTMPADSALTKIGKVYQNTCTMNQDSNDVTEHYEEGNPAPEYRKKTRKMPKLEFELMDCDEQALTDFLGGTNDNTTGWNFDTSTAVANKAIKLVTEHGMDFYIPNGDIDAVISAEFNQTGMFRVKVTVTPMSVTTGGALRAKQKAS